MQTPPMKFGCKVAPAIHRICTVAGFADNAIRSMAVWVRLSIIVPLFFLTSIAAAAHTANLQADSLRPSAVDTALADSDASRAEMIKKKIKKTGGIIYRFIKNFDDYDTDYIQPNYYNYTAMLQNTNFYQMYSLRGQSADGISQSIQMSPSPSFKIGPYFGWRWIFLGYTMDMGHPKKAGKTSEFNLSLYSSMLGGDFVYIRNGGDFKIKKVRGFADDVAGQVRNADFSGLETKTISLNLYYVFNHRHFSYPAAFSQSTVQRKSCGSWMLGVRFDRQRMDFDYLGLPPSLAAGLIDEMKVSSVDYYNYSISGGYAYNWVFAPRWLFSASASPSIGYKKANGEKVSGEALWVNMKNFNFDFIFRAGLVWNNSKWFAGASLVSHLYDYRRDRFALTNSINYLNIYVGFCFNRKRQYR